MHYKNRACFSRVTCIMSNVLPRFFGPQCTAKAAYSRQTFPVTICRYVGLSVCLSSALWKNGGSDPDADWHDRSGRSMDKAGSGVWGSVNGNG